MLGTYGQGIYCTAKQQSANQDGPGIRTDTEEQNKMGSSITDQCLEGIEFVMNVAFQTGRQGRIYCLTSVSGTIKGKIKLFNE